MKVVLFCGGMGMRLRDYSDKIPKPLVEVGPRPILWHLMKYYAHFGHRDFVLCLGHGARAIKEFFLQYDERETNDFVFTDGGRSVELLGTDIDQWRITFVDTGLRSNVGERLRRVRPHLEGEEMFLANYADGLSDLDLDDHVERFRATDHVASFVTVPAPLTFHNVRTATDGRVLAIEQIGRTPIRVNAGFFVLRQEIFDHLRAGEELVEEPFARLIAARRLLAYPFDGYWQPMDTFKDKNALDAACVDGPAPWEVWRRPSGPVSLSAVGSA